MEIGCERPLKSYLLLGNSEIILIVSELDKSYILNMEEGTTIAVVNAVLTTTTSLCLVA